MIPAARRWYVAYERQSRRAVLRSKDPAGLDAWRSRRWKMFPAAPVIEDVTECMGSLLATIAIPDGFRPGREGANVACYVPRAARAGHCLAVAAHSDQGAQLLVRQITDDPDPREVAYVRGGLGEVLADLVNVALNGAWLTAAWAVPRQFTALSAFPVGQGLTREPRGVRPARPKEEPHLRALTAAAVPGAVVVAQPTPAYFAAAGW